MVFLYHFYDRRGCRCAGGVMGEGIALYISSALRGHLIKGGLNPGWVVNPGNLKVVFMNIFKCKSFHFLFDIDNNRHFSKLSPE